MSLETAFKMGVKANLATAILKVISPFLVTLSQCLNASGSSIWPIMVIYIIKHWPLMKYYFLAETT